MYWYSGTVMITIMYQQKNVPELDLTGSRPHRCSTLAIPLLLLHQQAELLYKNINNHLTTFGTKLNLGAHTNIKHYINK